MIQTLDGLMSDPVTRSIVKSLNSKTYLTVKEITEKIRPEIKNPNAMGDLTDLVYASMSLLVHYAVVNTHCREVGYKDGTFDLLTEYALDTAVASRLSGTLKQ